jgi:hypothetical protein
VAALLGLGIGLFNAFAPRDSKLVPLQWMASLGPIVFERATVRRGLVWDLAALIPGYAVGLALAGYLGRRVFWTPLFHAWAAIGIAASVAAGVLNGVQDWLIWIGVGEAQPNMWLFRAIEALSFAKFAALLVASLVGAAALVTTTARLVLREQTQKDWETARGELPKTDVAFPPPPVAADYPVWKQRSRPFVVAERLYLLHRDLDQPITGSMTHWAESYQVPEEVGGIAICASGGGHRSATVTLGMLQALRNAGKLFKAKQIISVSGGGYMVGGFQLALTPKDDGPVRQGAAVPDDVFAPGSAEEDHLRRHSSYLADGLGQWLTALAVLFRSVAGSFVVIGLTITVVGLAIGRFYRHVPVVAGGLGRLKPLFLAAGVGRVPPFPIPPWGVWLGIAAPAAIAAVVYLVQLVGVWDEGRPTRLLVRIAKVLVGATAWLTLLGVGLPAAIWASSAITRPLGLTPGTTAYSGALDLLLAYLSAVGALVWRNRQSISSGASTVIGFANKSIVNRVLPSSMVQMLLIWLSLLVAIVVSLLLAGWVATSGLDDSWWALAPVGALGLIVAFVDQTWFSLHPFYRQRLASAFAVRRARRHSWDVAEPYEFGEVTALSRYASPRPPFPTPTFNAAANLTGQDRTPPGRRAVSYTLRHDFVGGPHVGWIRTDYLEKLVSRHLGRDLTVEAAMAISGAAFASAMGSQTRFYEVFLALANVRLGAWLPNPYFVALKNAHIDNWTIPGLPQIRRLSYLFREIFGIHPVDSRLVLCTDGGHYDNLGLVEALRRRCEVICCLDATGYSQPLASTLAGTIALAREELGIDIKLRGPYDLVPGSGRTLGSAASLADLNSRLSQSSVITGTIAYPGINELPPIEGTLIVAQVNLTPDTPYHLLEFRQEYPDFPWEGSYDQWYNYAQFDAYQELGRFLGTQAAQHL